MHLGYLLPWADDMPHETFPSLLLVPFVALSPKEVAYEVGNKKREVRLVYHWLMETAVPVNLDISLVLAC